MDETSEQLEEPPKEGKPFQFSIIQLIYFTSTVAIVCAYISETLNTDRKGNIFLLIVLYGLSILALTLSVSFISIQVGKLTGLALGVFLLIGILVLTILFANPPAS